MTLRRTACPERIAVSCAVYKKKESSQKPVAAVRD
jgi:hypothetical protein